MSEDQFRIPPPGAIPSFTPEHQKKITRGKWFEIVIVLALIVAGAGFLAYRNYRGAEHADAAATLAQCEKAMQAAGAMPDGKTTFFQRECLSFKRGITDFDVHIDLIAKNDESPMDTAVIWLTVAPGKDNASTGAFQNAVNTVGSIGQQLVFSSAEAMQKAANTMVRVTATKRPHAKGVGGSEGWKVTYVTYDEASGPEPALCYVIQRLEEASDPELGDMNRVLYETVQQGGLVKDTLLAVGGKR